MALRWKDVVAITKEKTALVIPNAIQLCTENDERHFFTSFAARDRSYMMLFKLWQNALLDQVNGHLKYFIQYRLLSNTVLQIYYQY